MPAKITPKTASKSTSKTATKAPVRRVTQRAIADRLGLRQATVSRVLAGSDLIAVETRERVLAAATEMGYRPNLAARGIRGDGAYGAIAYAISTHPSYNTFEPAMVQAISAAVHAADQHCLLASIDHERLDDPSVVTELLGSLMTDALILGWVKDLPPLARDTLARMRVPTIQVNAPGATDCVRFADRAAAATVAESFLQAGHRRLAFLDFGVMTSLHDGYFHYSNRDRWLGFAETVRGAGIEARRLSWPERIPEAERVSALREVLTATDRPTAVLCYNYDGDALPLLFAAQQHGLRIPHDLSVACFHHRASALCGLPLAHCHLDFAALGRAAVALTLRKLKCPTIALTSHEEPIPFDSGRSVLPPP